MRNSPLIDVLMPRTRQAILVATLLQPDRAWYLSDLARHLHVRPSSLQRELAALTAAGILKNRREGRMVYFQADPECPIFPDLRGLLLKTAGLVDVLRAALASLAPLINTAFVYGSVAQASERSASDIDLMVIGDISLSAVVHATRNAAQRLAREINPSTYNPHEFARRLASRDHFIESVFHKPKLFVYGSQHELGEIAQ
jgi:DNA-binding transcriptional ArsR family regulator